MFASYRSPNSLSKKMMRVIFSIYLFVTCLITSMQFLTEYLKTQNSISYELKQLQETVQGPVSTSLWQYDQTQLDVLVDGLIKMPVIEGVDVFDKHGKSMISKRSYTQASLPLSIFETKSEDFYNKIVVVDCDTNTQILRASQRDNKTEESILKIIGNQATREERFSIADYVINNDSSYGNLKKEVIKTHQLLLGLKVNE